MESGGTDPIRGQAYERLKKKRAFNAFVGTYVVINLVMVGIWLLTDRGYFWPAWVLLGTTIALISSWWAAFGAKPITDKDIEDETRRLKGDG
ncbi:MAG: 2TM domain-containing protein [Actinomycetota bacterium]